MADSPSDADVAGGRRSLTPGERFRLAVATGLFSGHSPVASGTAGTLVAVPLHLMLARLPAGLYLLSAAAFVAVAIWAAQFAGEYYGDSDDRRLVADEIAGYLVAMALVQPTILSVAVGFVAFRLMDIVKPWPASYFDKKVHNAFGAVMDDVVAGAYARVVVAAVVHFLP